MLCVSWMRCGSWMLCASLPAPDPSHTVPVAVPRNSTTSRSYSRVMYPCRPHARVVWGVLTAPHHKNCDDSLPTTAPFGGTDGAGGDVPQDLVSSPSVTPSATSCAVWMVLRSTVNWPWNG
eukprot:gene8864-biopygen2771